MIIVILSWVPPTIFSKDPWLRIYAALLNSNSIKCFNLIDYTYAFPILVFFVEGMAPPSSCFSHPGRATKELFLRLLPPPLGSSMKANIFPDRRETWKSRRGAKRETTRKHTCFHHQFLFFFVVTPTPCSKTLCAENWRGLSNIFFQHSPGR